MGEPGPGGPAGPELGEPGRGEPGPGGQGGELGPGVRERRRFRDSAAGSILVVVIAAAVVLAGVWVVGMMTKGAEAALSATSSAGGVTQIEVAAGGGAAPTVGEAAPDFTTFTTDGDDLELSALAGKPVWLVFGATWCANCRAETPDIQALHEKYGDKVEIVAVYVGETISTAAGYATRLGLTYPQVADASKDIASRYRVVGLPTHYFIGADGKVAAIDIGGLTQQAASKRIDALLAG